jgi:uncharacterized protein
LRKAAPREPRTSPPPPNIIVSPAQLEHPSAQLRYGIALLNGRGVEIDPFHAESWLRRAALAGESTAAAIIGDLYVRPGDVPPNYAEAGLCCAVPPRPDMRGAAKMLGHLLLTGAGVAPRPGGSCSLVACRHRRW